MSVSGKNIAVAVLLALLAATILATAFHYDEPVRESVLAMQGKGWKKSETRARYGALSRYGDWPGIMVLGAAGWLAAWALRSRDWKRITLAAMTASTLSGALVNTVRLTTGHTRPYASPEIAQGWYGPYHDGKFTIGDPKYNSFPSGHTATAVGFAGVILFARPLLGVFAMVGALGIAWSRIALGAHHPSDVTAGALVSLVIAWLVWRAAEKYGDRIAAAFAKRFSRKKP
jgi:membrane-associated phospholipid phosphatase